MARTKQVKRTRVAKRKGPSSSRSPARDKAAKEGAETKASDKEVDHTFRQRTRECCQLDGKLAELSEKESKLENKKRKLEDQKRKLEEQLNEQLQSLEEQLRPLEKQLRPLKREVKEVQQHLLTKRKRIEEIENTERLFFKLPPELWEKILDNLESDDLFPLALSCRYFRQKQKGLVVRASRRGTESGKPHLALKTNLRRKLDKGKPASAEYIQFARQEPGSTRYGSRTKNPVMAYLAAYHGHLSLLQVLLKYLPWFETRVAWEAGKSSSPQFLLFLCFSF